MIGAILPHANADCVIGKHIIQMIINFLFFILMVTLGVWVFTETQLPLYPAWLLAWGIVTFCYYGFDKFRAQRKQWRVAEWMLNLMTLFGGILGAWVGMFWFRHKTQDQSVKRWLWVSTAVHITLIYFGFASV